MVFVGFFFFVCFGDVFRVLDLFCVNGILLILFSCFCCCCEKGKWLLGYEFCFVIDNVFCVIIEFWFEEIMVVLGDCNDGL